LARSGGGRVASNLLAICSALLAVGEWRNPAKVACRLRMWRGSWNVIGTAPD
jgi:hypothetical protein